jgi:hypothetical protein
MIKVLLAVELFAHCLIMRKYTSPIHTYRIVNII